MKIRQGFTLIELLVTITIMAVIITVLTGVLTSVIKAQLQTQTLLEVKKNGDTVIANVNEAIRTSKQVNVDEVAKTIKFTTQGDRTYTLGYTPQTGTNCNNGKNGYIYVIEGTALSTDESNKITNDSLVDGVNITSFILSADTTSITPIVDLEMIVDKNLCSKYAANDVARKFRTSVSARAFFND